MSARVVCVGDLGRALTAMSPSGVVELVYGERVDARSEREFIPSGAAVVVLRGDPTGYVVREVGPGKPVPQLPETGAEIRRAEFMWNSAEVRRAEARDAEEVRRAWAKASRRRALVAGTIGLVAGLGNAALARGIDPDPLLWGAAAGQLTGLAVALIVGRLGYFLKWSPVAALFAILGGLVGAETGFWAHVAAGANLPAALAAGALAGTVAGGWVGRNIDVLGGPDAGG
jgi:hypothetical protein